MKLKKFKNFFRKNVYKSIFETIYILRGENTINKKSCVIYEHIVKEMAL